MALEPPGNCRLCGQLHILQNSHVLPSFIFRWMKQAGHIRHSQAVNKRTQDGAKERWLCRECEGLLNSFETPFATNIFHPYDLDPSVCVRYHEWFLKFCVSVSWRSLLYMRENAHFTNFSENQVDAVESALSTWAKYLLGEYKHPGSFEQHLLPLGEIQETTIGKLPTNINRYFSRTIDINLGASASLCFVYSKFGPFALFGFIQSKHPGQWKGTRVGKQGWFRPASYTVPVQLQSYLFERAEISRRAMAKISPTQQKKIEESIRENPDRFLSSSLFRAMQRDVELFGSDAFIKYDDGD